ncbi:MAG: type II secretion system F family protein [Acidimicrobiia bacterium]|nr:type II secretion system F family protein [Acidimicrobiia bacterium]
MNGLRVAVVLVVPAVVLAAAWRRRPAPARLRALVGAPVAGEVLRSARRVPEVLGRRVRRVGRRPADPVLDRRVGGGLVAFAVGVPVHPALGFLVGVGVWGASWWRSRREAAAAHEAVLDETPDVVELLVLAVDAGLSPRLAVEEVGHRVDGTWGIALRRVAERVATGTRLADALESLPGLVGESARPVTAALIDAVRYGTSLGPSLERVAREAADDRRRRAEERARRVPVRLLFPLVLCTLPAFALLTIVPLLAGSLRSIPL